MDPLTMAAMGVGVHVVGRVVISQAETKQLGARAELARAVAALPPGTTLSGTGPAGSSWEIRVPAAAVPQVREDAGEDG